LLEQVGPLGHSLGVIGRHLLRLGGERKGAGGHGEEDERQGEARSHGGILRKGVHKIPGYAGRGRVTSGFGRYPPRGPFSREPWRALFWSHARSQKLVAKLA